MFAVIVNGGEVSFLIGVMSTPKKAMDLMHTECRGTFGEGTNYWIREPKEGNMWEAFYEGENGEPVLTFLIEEVAVDMPLKVQV